MKKVQLLLLLIFLLPIHMRLLPLCQKFLRCEMNEIRRIITITNQTFKYNKYICMSVCTLIFNAMTQYLLVTIIVFIF